LAGLTALLYAGPPTRIRPPSRDRGVNGRTILGTELIASVEPMPATKPIAPFAAGPIWSMAGVVVAAQLIAAIVGYGYWFDEVYMVAIGRHHLDWGSAGQPPLTPAIACMVDVLFQDSVVALRIPAIIATAGCVVVAGLIAREMGCDRRAQTLVAAAQATTLWTTWPGIG